MLIKFLLLIGLLYKILFTAFSLKINTEICPDIFMVNKNVTSKHVVALILARGGSKGIPLKNLVKVNGVSLLGRSLIVIKSVEDFPEVWVSTDHEDIAKEAEKYGALVHWRPSETAADKTSSIDSVQEFLLKHPHIEKLALIQCTSIFLKKNYLIEALKRFQHADCVFSVTKSFKLRWNYDSDQQYVIPINFNPMKRPRRQDWNGELIETGMFYFAKTSVMEKNLFQNDRCQVVEINEADSLEIDSPFDLKMAKIFMDFNTMNENKCEEY